MKMKSLPIAYQQAIYGSQGSLESIRTLRVTGVVPDMTAVILAGGKSSRMKRNKALLPCNGEFFIERIHRLLAPLFSEVIVVTNTPELYPFLPCGMVSDEYPGLGSLAGIHAGLKQSGTGRIFAVACDMPYLNADLIRLMASRAVDCDIVIPESGGGLEPLHTIYGKGCIPAMEKALSSGSVRIVDCFDWSRVAVVSKEQVAAFDPEFLSFENINTPEDYFRFRSGKDGQTRRIPSCEKTSGRFPVTGRSAGK